MKSVLFLMSWYLGKLRELEAKCLGFVCWLDHCYQQVFHGLADI